MAELLNHLQKEIRQSAGNQKDKPNVSKRTDQLERSIRKYIEREDIRLLESALQEIQSLYPQETVRKITLDILDLARNDIDARTQNLNESIDGTIDKAVAAAFAAKKPAELDGYIIDLTRLAQRPGDESENSSAGTLSKKARVASEFLCDWQDYLVEIDLNHKARADEKLRIMNGNARYLFVPRSGIYDRIRARPSSNLARNLPPEDPFKVPDLKDKKLKDLDPLTIEVGAYLLQNPNQGKALDLLGTLNGLQRAWLQLKMGMVQQAFDSCMDPDNAGPDLPAARRELLMKIVPVYLEAAKKYPVKERETCKDYLLRVVNEARADKDWNTVLRALSIYRRVTYSNETPEWISADIDGIIYFKSAQNYEKAGQYRDAVRYYKRSLSLPGLNLPVAETFSRLTALQKEQPLEFEAAINNPNPEPTVMIFPIIQTNAKP